MRAERILLEMEVQRDFFSPGGSRYTQDSPSALARIGELFHWASCCGLTVISTVLRIRPSQRSPLDGAACCIDGTAGETKLPQTVLPDRINMGLRNTTDLPDDLLWQYRQIIFEKRCTNIFAHARADRLITQLRSGTFVLCGAGLARGIVEAAIGLRSRGFSVIVASDAVLSLGDEAADMARLRMRTKGVIFLPTDRIVATGAYLAIERRGHTAGGGLLRQ